MRTEAPARPLSQPTRAVRLLLAAGAAGALAGCAAQTQVAHRQPAAVVSATPAPPAPARTASPATRPRPAVAQKQPVSAEKPKAAAKDSGKDIAKAAAKELKPATGDAAKDAPRHTTEATADKNSKVAARPPARPAAEAAAKPATGTAASTAHASHGIASFYRHGTLTASGEKFDMNEFTAAHRTLPFGTRLRVTNLATGRSVLVRVNDRGPFIEGRVVDVSYAAAESLGFTARGVTRVKLDVVR